jgi:hypothetical protein
MPSARLGDKHPAERILVQGWQVFYRQSVQARNGELFVAVIE